MAEPADPVGGYARIESASNPRLRALIALVESSRERRKHGRSVLEGRKLIEAYETRSLADAGLAALQALFVTDDALEREDIQALARRHARVTTVVPERLLRRASRLETPDGTMAIIPTPAPELPTSFTRDVVYLDRLQDPGNLGTILRTCAAAQIAHVVTAPETVFCWSPKVLRAAMGAHFSLTIHEGVEPAALFARVAKDLIVRATVVETAGGGVIPLYDADLRAPGVWLFGAEGQGLHSELLDSPCERLSIPQAAGVESLNVSAAAAVCLFEQRRQRLVRPTVSGTAP